MKKLVTFLLIILFFMGCESMQKTKPELLNTPVSNVYDFKGMNKNAVFDKSISWFAEKFNSANDVIQLKDKANGKIIAQCVGSVFYTVLTAGWDAYFSYTLKIDIKDNKAKVSFSNIAKKDVAGTRGLDPEYEDQYKLIVQYLNTLSASYETYLNAKEDKF